MFLLLAAIAVTAFSRIRVNADHTVRYGFHGQPRTRVPIHRIASLRGRELVPVRRCSIMPTQ